MAEFCGLATDVCEPPQEADSGRRPPEDGASHPRQQPIALGTFVYLERTTDHDHLTNDQVEFTSHPEKERTFPMRQPLSNFTESLRSRLALVAFSMALATCSAGSGIAQEDIASQIAAAREKFAPITTEQVDAAKLRVVTTANALERFVRPNSANGRQWLKYLKWDDFKKELAADGQIKLAPLVATYNQLNKDQVGLELKPYRNLANALRNYMDLSVIAAQANQAEAYGRELDGLTTDLTQYDSKSSSATAAAIGRRLDVLTGLGQAGDLVAAVREKYSHPNAFVTVSTDLLRAAAADPIDRRDPVTDVILGARIRGLGHTTGKVTLDTIPNDKMAVIKLTTDGRVVSQNRGYKGPAVIRSTSYTDFVASQLVEFTANRFRALPAQVSARTGSRIHSVSKAGGGIGSRLVASQGMQRAREKQGQANRIAAQHAETRIARKMSNEIDSRLSKAWNRYRNDYLLPLERRGDAPKHTRFSTTDDSLAFETMQVNRSQLGAPAAPPESPAGADIVASLHETAINNYIASILGGATLSESEAGAGTKADVRLPAFLKDAWKNRMDEKADNNAEFEPWSLTFQRGRPISVAFADGKVQLTLHILTLTSGDDVFERPGWDVTATYTAELKDGGVTLTRDGELNVLPAGFDAEKGQLSAKQVAVRRNLSKVLTERSDQGRGIPMTIRVDRLEPKDELADVGPLPVKDFASNGGWLTVAWVREADHTGKIASE